MVGCCSFFSWVFLATAQTCCVWVDFVVLLRPLLGPPLPLLLLPLLPDLPSSPLPFLPLLPRNGTLEKLSHFCLEPLLLMRNRCMSPGGGTLPLSMPLGLPTSLPLMLVLFLFCEFFLSFSPISFLSSISRVAKSHSFCPSTRSPC